MAIIGHRYEMISKFKLYDDETGNDYTATINQKKELQVYDIYGCRIHESNPIFSQIKEFIERS